MPPTPPRRSLPIPRQLDFFSATDVSPGYRALALGISGLARSGVGVANNQAERERRAKVEKDAEDRKIIFDTFTDWDHKGIIFSEENKTNPESVKDFDALSSAYKEAFHKKHSGNTDLIAMFDTGLAQRYNRSLLHHIETENFNKSQAIALSIGEKVLTIKESFHSRVDLTAMNTQVEELNATIADGVNAGTIDPKVAVKMRLDVNNIPTAAMFRLLTNEQWPAVLDFLDSPEAKAIPEPTFGEIKRSATAGQKTNNNFLKKKAADVAEGFFDDLRNKGIRGTVYNKEDVLSLYKDPVRRDLMEKHLDSEEYKAIKYFNYANKVKAGTSREMLEVQREIKTPLRSTYTTEELEAGKWQNDKEVEKDIKTLIIEQNTLRREDPYSFYSQNAKVQGLQQRLNSTKDPEEIRALSSEIRKTILMLQEMDNVPLHNQSVMSPEMAEDFVDNLNNMDSEQIINEVGIFLQLFGEDFPTAFQDLLKLDEGKGVNGSVFVTAMHTDTENGSVPKWLNTALAAQGTDFSFLPEESIDAVNGYVPDNILYKNFIANKVLSNPGAKNMTSGLHEFLTNYALALLGPKMAKKKDPFSRSNFEEETVADVSKLVFGQFIFTLIDGEPMMIPKKYRTKDKSLKEYTPNELEFLPSYLEILKGVLDWRSFDVRGLATATSMPWDLDRNLKWHLLETGIQDETTFIVDPTTDSVTLYHGYDIGETPQAVMAWVRDENGEIVKDETGKNVSEPYSFKFSEVLETRYSNMAALRAIYPTMSVQELIRQAGVFSMYGKHKDARAAISLKSIEARGAFDFLLESEITTLREEYPWVERAISEDLSIGDSSVLTAVERDDRSGQWMVFPTIRKDSSGNLEEKELREAQRIAVENQDFIPVRSLEEGQRISKGLSTYLGTGEVSPLETPTSIDPMSREQIEWTASGRPVRKEHEEFELPDMAEEEFSKEVKKLIGILEI